MKIKRYDHNVEIKNTYTEGGELVLKAESYMEEKKIGSFIAIGDLPKWVRLLLRLN